MSMTPFDPEDPRLTAYALGELDDPAERAAVETLLEHHPEARQAMKDIQDITQSLTAEYDHERRTALVEAPVGHEPVEPPAPNVIRLPEPLHDRRSWVRPLFAAAAVLLLIGYLASLGVSNRAQRAASLPPVQTELAEVPQSEAVQELRLPEETPAIALAQADAAKEESSESAPPVEDSASSGAISAASPAAPALAYQAPPMNSDKQEVPGVASGAMAPAPVPAGPAASSTVPRYGIVGGRPSAYHAQVPGALAMAKPMAGSSGTGGGGRSRSLAGSTTLFANTLPARRGLENQDALAETTPDAESPELGASARAIAPLKVTVLPNQQPGFNTAAYDHLVENAFLAARDNPLSTFSIDVDTASYANVRRFLDSGSLPPPDAVRLEELINYFPYNYAPPTAESKEPFAVHLEAAACPWAPEHRLVRIGIKGKEIAVDKRPPSNLVFLLDVSGSMEPSERLPLIKQAMKLLVEQLTGNDHVAIVVYSGNSGLVLPSTDGNHKSTILAALDRLEAGGSTNGASGIALAYKVAKENFIKEGTNRVILATDGDFNVGVTNQGDLVRLIEREARGGVFLSALGVGTDNYKDSTMQKLADKGNGNYNYIDRLDEARKVLVEQMSGTLLTIAKDVKIQVEFNPAVVGSYRLVGYEKRMLKKEDFNNDKIDAGEIGAGHSVTALYEVVPIGRPVPGEVPAVDTLRYAATDKAAPAAPTLSLGPVAAESVKPAPPAASGEMLTVKLRHKAPNADTSVRSYEQSLTDHGTPDDFAKASPDFKFAAAVAEFGLSLRDSPYKGNATLGAAVEMAQEGKGADPKGYRAGFIELARKAQTLRDAQNNP